MTDRSRLMILLLGTFLLSALWAFLIPTTHLGFQPDESSHFAVIRFMAENHGALPPYRMGYDTGVHPPLYHEAAALLYSIVFPALGSERSVVAVRLLSALIGSGTVYAVYLLARQTRLARTVALPAAALAALIPMRLSLSGAATNENLAALGATATLVVLYAALRRGFTARRIFFLSFWTVVAVGSKITCVGLLPAIAIGAIIRRRRGLELCRTVAAMVAPAVAVLLALGWWFADNTLTYGDPLRKAAADRMWDGVQPGYAVISEQHDMAPWRYLLSILGGGWFSFWGQFDGMQYRLRPGIYVAILLGHLFSGWGLCSDWRRLIPRTRARLALAAATLAFAAWVLLIYIQYNWLHYTPQGRYFFVLLGPIMLLLVGGIDRLLRRYFSGTVHQRLIWQWGGTLLLLLNLYVLFVMTPSRNIP